MNPWEDSSKEETSMEESSAENSSSEDSSGKLEPTGYDADRCTDRSEQALCGHRNHQGPVSLCDYAEYQADAELL